MLLGNRQFRRLWAASAVDSLGSWLLVMAVPLHVFALTGSAMSTGLALAVQAAPAVLVGPWAGAVVDRRSRRTVLVVANLAGAAAVALMALGTTPGRLGFVYLGLALENVAVCFLGPALAAVTPTVVDPADLPAANALSAATASTLRMLGPLAGTLLVEAGRFRTVVLIDAATYLAAAAVIGTVAIPRTPRPARAAAGPSLVLRVPLLRGLLVTSWLYWTANAALTALLVPFIATRLHGPDRALGYLVAGLGLGYLAGSALSGVLIERFATRTILVAAYAAVGGCFLVMFTTTALPVALAAVTAAGVPGAVAKVVTGYRVQTGSEDAVRGRAAAAFYTSDCVAAVAGALLGPAIAALTGLVVALPLLSAVVLATAGLAVILLPAPTGREWPARR
ncbi:MFS transporter [Dactylosporangium sp. NPDC049140]|uniref:MFS transporter n=1 Tax=Dactylosporangium sp. NPDC049140 TaxID=3155647 RepID=UPI0033C2272C